MRIEPKKKYGKLTIVREIEPLRLPCGQTNRAFLCRCDCGNEKVVRLLHLSHGRIRSCGCLAPAKHGMRGTKLHNIWRGMKNRCYGDHTIQPHLYKDRGIRVCEEWHKFPAFAGWALKNGYSPDKIIDRINGDGDYEPENCRFVTPLESCANRTVTLRVRYHNELVSLSYLLHTLHKHNHYSAIRCRILRGWDAERAIDTPIRRDYRRFRVDRERVQTED